MRSSDPARVLRSSGSASSRRGSEKETASFDWRRGLVGRSEVRRLWRRETERRRRMAVVIAQRWDA